MGKFVPIEFAEKIGNSGVLGVLIQVNLTAIALERYSQRGEVLRLLAQNVPSASTGRLAWPGRIQGLD
jgi:hypothetical protein